MVDPGGFLRRGRETRHRHRHRISLPEAVCCSVPIHTSETMCQEKSLLYIKLGSLRYCVTVVRSWVINTCMFMGVWKAHSGDQEGPWSLIPPGQV